MTRFLLCLLLSLAIPALAQAQKAPALKKAPVAQKIAAKTAQVNINTAGADELTALNGIGKKKAAAIVADRKKNGLFKTVDELRRVKGVGPRTIEKNRAQMTVGDLPKDTGKK